MAFEMTDTEAKVIWKMQRAIHTDDLYMQMNGQLSRQYVFQLVRTMKLKGYVNRMKTGKKVRYIATKDAVKEAEKILQQQNIN